MSTVVQFHSMIDWVVMLYVGATAGRSISARRRSVSRRPAVEHHSGLHSRIFYWQLHNRTSSSVELTASDAACAGKIVTEALSTLDHPHRPTTIVYIRPAT